MIWVLFLKEWSYDLYEMIPGFLVGFALTVGVSLLTEVPEGVGEEFRRGSPGFGALSTPKP